MFSSSTHHAGTSRSICLLTLLALAATSSAFAALTAHYRLDETSGTIISAQVGPAGSLAGTGCTWIPGQMITNALSFEGNGNAYVEDNGALDFGDPINPALTTNNNYTVSFWAYIPSTAAQPGAILVQKGKTGEVTYGFRLDATTGNSIDFFRDRAQSGNYVKNTGALALDTWHHVAGVFNRNQAVIGDISPQNELKVFVDGKIISGTRSSSGNVTNSSGRLTIGARDAGSGSFANRFLGTVDDVGMWSECLAYKKIGAIYALGIFEGVELSSPQIDLFVNAFLNQGSIAIGANNWHYTTGLGSTTIGTTGGTAGVDAYVVLDSSGNGMKLGPGAAPTLTAVATLTGATEETPFTITYAALSAGADEADVDSSPLSFLASKVYGTLTKDGLSVVPGVTLLSAGETWVWTPNINVSGPAVTAFTVRAYDGAYQSFAVPVTVNVANVPDNPSLAYLNFNETATFDSEVSATAQGWTAFNPYHPIVWANTSYAGGTVGEAGGTFGRVPAAAAGYYADTDLGVTLGLDDSVSASGRLIFTNNVSFNNNIYLGHFNTNGFAGLNSSFVGLQFNENSVTNLRMYAYMRLQDGTVRTSVASTAIITNIAYFDYNYSPSGNSGLGQLVVNLRDSGSNVLATQTANLISGDKDTGGQLVAWGASEGALDLTTASIDMFWDNVSYTRLPQAASAPSSLSYTSLYPAVVIAPTSMIVRDGDNSLSNATVQITGNYQNGQDMLVYTQIGNIAGSWNSGTGTLTLSGVDTVADYQAALWSVKYRNLSTSPSLLARTVSFKANDGTMDTATLTRDISVSAAPAGFHVLSLSTVGSAGTAVFGFLGAPGYKYALDRSTNLNSPTNWIALVTNTAPPSGVLGYTNTSPAPANFFRTRLVP